MSTDKIIKEKKEGAEATTSRSEKDTEDLNLKKVIKARRQTSLHDTEIFE